MREPREAEADLPAVLRLIDAGKVRVTDKKRVPTEASRAAVAGVLTGGDSPRRSRRSWTACNTGSGSSETAARRES